MKKLSLSKNVLKAAKGYIGKNGPDILTGVGIAGMLSATVMAVKATPKAIKLIEERKKRLDVDKLPAKEVVKTAWKCYIPSAVTTGISTACLICATKEHHKRGAALATAYTLSETAFKEYKDKVVETIGEKKEKTVRDAIAKDKVQSNPYNNEVIVNNGNMLCLDSISGRYFKSSIELIKQAENTLNKRMLNENYISLNDFYYELGLPPIAIGNDIGWNINDDMINTVFSAQLATDNTPCLYLEYRVAPRMDYTRLH